MKIYVAGSWEDRKDVKAIMWRLECDGHVITEDWTKHEDPALGHEYCIKDMQGIDECDVFVMYLSKKKSFGKAFEMGFASAKDKHIIVFGDPTLATSVFFKMSGTTSFNNCEVLRMIFIDTIEYLTAYLTENEIISK